jgi:hypothetical protein
MINYRSLNNYVLHLNKKRFSFLVHNLPPQTVYVRKEYLTQFKYGHGEYEEGRWVSVKAKRERALLFETMLIEYGALYDKLPISAFVWRKDADPKEFLPLDYLELFDSLSYYITVTKKTFMNNLKCNVLMKNGKFYQGQYMFTIDFCNPDPGFLDTTYSEVNPEHKSYNVIKLFNGQFCAQPNNRIIWEHSSLIPNEKKKPYFKVCEEEFLCETTAKWDIADTDEYIYRSKSEKEIMDKEEEKETKK